VNICWIIITISLSNWFKKFLTIVVFISKYSGLCIHSVKALDKEYDQLVVVATSTVTFDLGL